MKILLITNYWYPYSNPGAFRWLGFGRYINFDVLTCTIPSMGYKDLTIDKPTNKAYRIGWKIPAVVWGLFAPFLALFSQYNLYIITVPPESLLFGAYILQLFGKKVLIDMRDPIDRKEQRLKFLIPIYKFFYKRITNVMVCWKFIDPSKPVVYHGYDEIERNPFALPESIYYTGRVDRKSYLKLLSYGIMQDYSHRPAPCFPSSSHTIKRLGFKINNKPNKELDELIPISNKEASINILKIIQNLK